MDYMVLRASRDPDNTFVCVRLCVRESWWWEGGLRGYKHHNGVSLPGLKERQKEKKRRGQMKGSPTSTLGGQRKEGQMGREKTNNASCKVLLISVISATWLFYVPQLCWTVSGTYS